MENTEKTTEDNKEQVYEEMKLTGADILKFFRKIFKAGNSRNVVWTTPAGKKIFSINMVLLALIVFILPIVALIAIVMLVVTDYSLSIEKNPGQ
ncbi:MAG: DUF4342 domain-containing protein [Candidatus Nomurabacteria bacterium]|nr:DUF4342 domain-containing protein [Candidatus Nomurabacteria bacterium]